MFWLWLEEEHPVLYEVLQWAVLIAAVVALAFGIKALIS